MRVALLAVVLGLMSSSTAVQPAGEPSVANPSLACWNMGQAARFGAMTKDEPFEHVVALWSYINLASVEWVVFGRKAGALVSPNEVRDISLEECERVRQQRPSHTV